MPPIIDVDLCTGCGTCHDMCPQDVFEFVKKTPPEVTYPEECWYCGACVVDCPEKAIRLKLPLYMHIVPSPALYGHPGEDEKEQLAKAADYSRSVLREET